MRVAIAAVVAALLASCNPYEQHSGEYYAGPVDPSAFPAAYRGPVVAAAATAHDVPAPYYAFPVADAADPLAVAAPPVAYAFDDRCTPPPGYAYDPRRDAYRLDEQGNVFTALPAEAGYAPLVAEWPITSNGEACQSIKSAATLLRADDVIVPAAPSARLVAWAIVDPGADVRPGPPRLGWIDHQLLAWIDGGDVPTSGDGTRLVAQNLYFPTATPSGPGALGDGFDLLDAARGEPGYSPLCHVFSFAPADPQHPPTSAAALDPAALADTGRFVWCLQGPP